MAARYWVGGTATWDATAGTKWALTDGGAGGQTVPGAADDVFFTALSGAVTCTWSATSPTVISITCTGFTGTLATGGVSKTLAGTGTVWTSPATCTITGAPTLTVNSSGSTAISVTCNHASPSAANAPNFSFTAGTYSLTLSGTGFRAVTFSGASARTVSGSISMYQNLTLSAAGTFTSLNPTLLGTATINTAGRSIGNVTINGSGITVTLGAALTSTGFIGLDITQGTFNTANFNVTAANFSSSNSNIRTITLGSSTVILSGTATPLNFGTSTNLTFNADTSSIIYNSFSTNLTFSGGGQTFRNVSFTATTNNMGVAIQGTNTFNNLTFTAPGSLTTKVTIAANQTVNGTLTINSGGTAVRRTLFQSSIAETQRTLTCNGSFSITDTDIRDIVITGTAAPATGTRIGDCGNNSGITFDAPKTVYWNLAGTQNWSDTGWATTNNGAPAVNNFPLAQDTAVFTEAGSAGTVTINANWNIGTIQMADGVSNRTTAFTLTTSLSAFPSPNIYGSVTLFTSLTISGTGTLTFDGTGTKTLTSAGRTFTQSIAVGNSSITVQLADAMTLNGTTLTFTRGTFTAANFNVTVGLFSSNNSNTRTLNMGSGTWTISGSGATAWNTATTTGLTVVPSTSTITMTSASAKTFAGGGLTYYNLNQGGAGTLTISGSNTFNNITNTVQPNTVRFTAGTTQTVSNFGLTGTAGNLITIDTTSAGVQATLSKASGIVSVNYLSVKDSNATGGAAWYAGATSTNVSNNTGWLFVNSPSGNMILMFI